jgi:membrane protease YdiL (CAAX protease family)
MNQLTSQDASRGNACNQLTHRSTRYAVPCDLFRLKVQWHGQHAPEACFSALVSHQVEIVRLDHDSGPGGVQSIDPSPTGAARGWVGNRCLSRLDGYRSGQEVGVHSGWGWEQASTNEVLRSAALLGVGHLAVAWNEEMVFRGYGFETVREALGQGKALAVLIPGFALYHGLDPQQLLGMRADGTTLMLLRLRSDVLWLPVSYHWAWNVLQTAIFGAPESGPSIRPLHLHGPERWLGRPGAPEPGLLRALIHLVIALLLWLWMRRSGTGSRRTSAT